MVEVKDIILTPKDIVKRNQNKLFWAGGYNSPGQSVITSKDVRENVFKSNDGQKVCGKWIDGSEMNYTYSGSAKEAETWNKIEFLRNKVRTHLKSNTIQFPAEYYDLYQAIVMDLTRRRMQEPDLTGILSNETTRLDAPNPLPIREMLGYSGEFQEYISGGQVPLIQAKTGAKDSMPITLYDLGFERDLYSVLFDMDIFSMQKVMEAVSRAQAGLRNNLVTSPLLTATWHTSQVQPADTEGGTYDERLYNTFLKAYKRLNGLIDIQTGQEIAMPEVILIVRNRVIAWSINRVIYGQIRTGEASKVINLSPLDINSIITYKGDSWTWGKKLVSYAGVETDEAYLVVPGTAGAPYFTVNKAPLTQEVGRGDVLTLSQEKRAWYFGQGNYNGEWMGSSGEFAAQYTSGYGYVVKIELPEETPST